MRGAKSPCLCFLASPKVGFWVEWELFGVCVVVVGGGSIFFFFFFRIFGLVSCEDEEELPL